MLTHIQRALIQRRATYFHQGSAFGVPCRAIDIPEPGMPDEFDEPSSHKEVEPEARPRLVP